MQPVNVRIYEEFEAYPFDSDDVFKVDCRLLSRFHITQNLHHVLLF